MEENKEFSLLDFFENSSEIDALNYKFKKHKALLFGTDLSPDNQLEIALTIIGRVLAQDYKQRTFDEIQIIKMELTETFQNLLLEVEQRNGEN